MEGYIHLFETKAQFDTARANDYVEPWLSYTESEAKVDYNKSEYEKLLGTPLTFEITGGGVIYWKAGNTSVAKTIEYKKNDGEWTTITSATGSSAPSISVAAGDTLQFRGNNTAYGTISYSSTFSESTAQFKVKGNIMSLINSTNFSGLTALESVYVFSGLFYYCTGLTDASKLILPATTLTEGCYGGMFQGCTSLTTAPELPATTLAQYCYWSMFQGCTSLTTAPELPATTLANNCYDSMFWGCASLTQAPELPATTLTTGCYQYMFYNCTNLNHIKCLATDISASQCTNHWVGNVLTSSGTFVKAASMTSWVTGFDGIPDGWTVVNAS